MATINFMDGSQMTIPSQTIVKKVSNPIDPATGYSSNSMSDMNKSFQRTATNFAHNLIDLGLWNPKSFNNNSGSATGDTSGNPPAENSGKSTSLASAVADATKISLPNAGGADFDINAFMDRAEKIQAANSAAMAAAAERQYEFNASEAQKNRDWQEYMSNTAHQREITDLVAAGLNPILSANGGNGAVVGSGATATGSQANVDTGLSQMFSNFMIALLNSATNIVTARQSAEAATSAAGIHAAASRYVADVSSSAQRFGSSIGSITGLVGSVANALLPSISYSYRGNIKK